MTTDSAYSNSTNRILISGFGLVLFLMGMLVATGAWKLYQNRLALTEIGEESRNKTEAAYLMRDAIRLRVDGLRAMVATDDPFERDEAKMHYFAYAGLYARSRQELIDLARYDEERAVLDALDAAAQSVREPNQRALDFLFPALGFEVSMVDTYNAVALAIEGHLTLLDELEALIVFQNTMARENLLAAEQEYLQNNMIMLLTGALTFMLTAVVGWVVVIKTREQNLKLTYQACHDRLTGLINRNEFDRRLHEVLRQFQTDGISSVFAYIDLDQFKIVNDTCGHAAGDQLLREVAGLFQSTISKRDTLARLGGDEFGVLLIHCDIAPAERVCNQLLASINDYRFSWQGRNFTVGASIGLVAIDEMTGDASEVLRRADGACYAAKDAGRNQIHIALPGDEKVGHMHGEMRWASEINAALDDERFRLYGQPIVPATVSGQAPGHFEVLLRMIDSQGEIVTPGQFLAAAERYSVMQRIDRWVIRNVLHWLSQNGSDGVTTLSVNVSGQSLSDQRFTDYVVDEINNSGVDPARLCFEITETAAVENFRVAAGFIDVVHGMGCTTALDDFGSGVSSFGYLRNFATDFVKIDGMFVRNINRDPTSQAIVRSVHEIASTMRLKTIAEFVENDDIARTLSDIGVDYLQGYGIGLPVALDQLELGGGTTANRIAG